MNLVIKFVRKKLFVLVLVVILIIIGGFYFYYNSESKLLERLAKDNPQKEELLHNINEAKKRLNETTDSKIRIEAFLDIAVAKTALGDLKGAISAYEKILNFSPTHNIAHENLASIYVSQGRYGKAEFEYLSIIATQPHLLDPYLRLADLYEGNIEEKENMVPAVLTFGINQNGKQPALLERLIRYYFNKQLYFLAGTQADELLEVDPSNAFAKDILEQIEAKS